MELCFCFFQSMEELDLSCPNSTCARFGKTGRLSIDFTKNGFYIRRNDEHKVIRYRCSCCGRTFSRETTQPEYRQQKRWFNTSLAELLASGLSQRRAARILGIDKDTVARRVRSLGILARTSLANMLIPHTPFRHVQFDEMESFEHSKCKPLSIPLAVCRDTRLILGFGVCQMPAKGHLAAIARKRYGKRPDMRPQAIRKLLANMIPLVTPTCRLDSDQCPRYPKAVSEYLPHAQHHTYEGRRGCVVGQGELKRGGFDPLFSLNHTAAMLRDNIKRLARKTWCTTKQATRLYDLISIYAWSHNAHILS